MNISQPLGYTKCCSGGQIKLPAMETPTPVVQELFRGVSRASKDFLKNARLINTKTSFASCTIDTFKFRTGGPPALRIHGQIFHNIGNVLFNVNDPTVSKVQFMQAFFYGAGDDTELTPSQNEIVRRIRDEAREYNSFYRTLLPHVEAYNDDTIPAYKLVIDDRIPADAPTRTYNLPTCVEVAAIACGSGDEDDQSSHRQLVIRMREGGIQKIYSNHSAYDTLAYVPFHMRGEQGWTYNAYFKHQLINDEWSLTNKKVSCMDYYSFRAHTRDDINVGAIQQDLLLCGRMLTQQYFCDQWIKTEEERLQWARNNQTKLKAELYAGLADAVAANETRLAGRFCVLPSSHQGSPRNMFQKFQDGMAIVRKKGTADFFITMTTNPKWREITENLKPGESAKDRPDLVARVFDMKRKAFMDYLTKSNVQGRCIGHLENKEYQKRK